MSMNLFSSDFPDVQWARRQQHMMEFPAKISSSKHKNENSMFQPQSYPTQNTMFCNQNAANFSFNLNDEELDEKESLGQLYHEREISKEPLFEKPLTPSDVGKLNRLVIPKQHAEKYFPLNGGDSGEKGMILSFEDELGKSWRFRFSYWNSSQSYVLTKGWSRFVKEKRLYAGDIVHFQRHRTDSGRIFIGWRRRNGGAVQDGGIAQPPTASAGGGHGGWTSVFNSGYPYPSHPQWPSLPFLPNCHAGSRIQNQTTVPSGNSRKLRLFGVNLEFESEPSIPEDGNDGSLISSQGQAPQYQFHPYNHSNHNHVDINYSGDVNQ